MKIHFESKTIVISKAFANKAPQKGNRSCTAGLMCAYTESFPERNNFAA